MIYLRHFHFAVVDMMLVRKLEIFYCRHVYYKGCVWKCRHS